MDLISQLIDAKKADKSLPILQCLQELVLYDKLSKSNKFEHICEAPVLQKRMPICWSAFNHDAAAFYVLTESATIIQTISDHPLAIFDDIAAQYNKKQQKQMCIIGNARHYNFYYQSLSALPSNFSFDNIICLSNTTGIENELIVSLIDLSKDDFANVYTGIIEVSETDTKQQSKVINFYVQKTKSDYVKIQTYSVQGNNDYPFAESKQYHISMSNSQTFLYTDKNDKLNVIKVVMTEADALTLNLHKSQIEVMANMILKYLPNNE